MGLCEPGLAGICVLTQIYYRPDDHHSQVRHVGPSGVSAVADRPLHVGSPTCLGVSCKGEPWVGRWSEGEHV